MLVGRLHQLQVKLCLIGPHLELGESQPAQVGRATNLTLHLFQTSFLAKQE